MSPIEQKMRDALEVTRALTRKYLNMVNFDGCDDRQITELREIHYQADEALSACAQKMNMSEKRDQKKPESEHDPEYKGQFAHLFNEDGSVK